MFSYLSILTYVLDAQKNHLIETILLSTQNICFGREIRKLFFRYTLLSKGLNVLIFFGSLNFSSYLQGTTASTITVSIFSPRQPNGIVRYYNVLVNGTVVSRNIL